MPRELARLGSCLIGLLLLTAGCERGTDPAYVAEVDAWHGERLANLRSETGWLTLVGLHPLGQGDNDLGADADNDVVMTAAVPAHLGVLRLMGEHAAFRAAKGIAVSRFGGEAAGEPFAGGEILTDGQGGPDMLMCGTVVFYVIQRGEKYFLRVKDTQARTLRDFAGIERYPVEESWRVEARLTGEPGTLRVANVLGQVAPEPTPGTLVFALSGKDCELHPTGEVGGEMFLVFGDATNGHGTYPGGRFLVVPAPDDEGRVILDFNRAYNPPCVFSSFATCPLPVMDNILPVAVTAGEKMWGTGH